MAELFAGRLYVHEGPCKVQALLLPVNQMNDLLYLCSIHQTCMKQEAYVACNAGRFWHMVPFWAVLASHHCGQLGCFTMTAVKQRFDGRLFSRCTCFFAVALCQHAEEETVCGESCLNALLMPNLNPRTLLFQGIPTVAYAMLLVCCQDSTHDASCR